MYVTINALIYRDEPSNIPCKEFGTIEAIINTLSNLHYIDKFKKTQTWGRMISSSSLVEALYVRKMITYLNLIHSNLITSQYVFKDLFSGSHVCIAFFLELSWKHRSVLIQYEINCALYYYLKSLQHSIKLVKQNMVSCQYEEITSILLD